MLALSPYTYHTYIGTKTETQVQSADLASKGAMRRSYILLHASARAHTHASYLDTPKYAQQMRKTKRVKAHANKDPASVRPLALIELMQLATLLSPKTARTINGLCPSSTCMRTHMCQ